MDRQTDRQVSQLDNIHSVFLTIILGPEKERSLLNFKAAEIIFRWLRMCEHLQDNLPQQKAEFSAPKIIWITDTGPRHAHSANTSCIYPKHTNIYCSMYGHRLKTGFDSSYVSVVAMFTITNSVRWRGVGPSHRYRLQAGPGGPDSHQAMETPSAWHPNTLS